MHPTQGYAPQRTSLSFGFAAFLGVLTLPFLLGIALYVGAWIVSEDVYAAQATDRTEDVAGWKHALVGVCPLH